MDDFETRIRKLVENLAEQQAMPDDSWQEELDAIFRAREMATLVEDQKRVTWAVRENFSRPELVLAQLLKGGIAMFMNHSPHLDELLALAENLYEQGVVPTKAFKDGNWAKFQFEGDFDLEIEDSGMAQIATIVDEGLERLFVRVQSWDETKTHPEMKSLNGKRVRVTVETVAPLTAQ